MYLVLACQPDVEPLRYELPLVEAAAMAKLLRSLGWEVSVFAELQPPWKIPSWYIDPLEAPQ